MPNKMLIDATHPEETRVVVVRGNRVEEFDFETAQRKQLRGNIYLAKVTRVEPSLQAAFIEYGGNRHGFLAFSEIHPDYYQIPVADRQALIEADERAHREAEEETDNRSSRGKRPRHRNSRRRGGNDRVQSAPITDASDSAPATADDQDHIVSAPTGEHGHDAHKAQDQNGQHPAPNDVSAGEQQQVHAGDHEEAATPADVMPTDQAAKPDHDAAEPAVIEPPEAPLSAAQHAGIPADHEASAPAPTVDADHADADHDEGHADDAHHDEAHHDDAHHELAAAHADDSEAHPAVAGDEAAADDDEDEDDDGDDAEEDVVESVGGDDVLEEVPERAFRPRRQYKIQEVIKRRQVMLVQVVKEERGNKGAALTTYLSLAGRYAVLMPNTARGGGISRKITSAQDRSRLKEVVQDLDVPEGMGIILRTAGAARTKPEIKRDFEYLIRMWETVRDMTLRSQAPTLVYEEGSLIKRSLRDLYNKEIDEILVAGDAGYQEARDFMKMLMPSNVRAVKPYRDTQPLFSKMGVESQLDAMFTPTVQLRSGGYIVINQTEALVSIDVNSGRSTREHHIEDTALKTNLEAAEEVARQLRLRDLAGLIVIDFIDMDEKRNNRAVERKMSDCLRQDRARIQVGRISHFGLLEMSRQRIRASVLESSTEPCPHCGGSGHVRSVSSVALQLLRGVEEILMKGATHNLTVRTRTDVALYVLNHKRGHLRDLEDSFEVTIAVIADPTVHGQQAYFIDRGEQVHTPEAAKAILAAQVAAAPVHVEEPFEEDESFEIEAEVETEETEGLVDEAVAADSGDSDTDADGRKRKRRRRRRGRSGEGRDETRTSDATPSTDDGDAVMAQQDTGEAAADEVDGDDEADAAGETRADGTATGDRRPRRRGRRGGRRRRNGTDDGLVGSIADELGPAQPSEVALAATTLDDSVVSNLHGSDHGADQPDSDQTGSDQSGSDQPWIDDVARSTGDDRVEEPPPRAEAEALHERSPQPAPLAPADTEQDKAAARRRSTVREKVRFTSAPADADASAETAPQPQSAPAAAVPEPAAEPSVAAETPAAAEPRKAGWWSRRFGGGA